MNHKNGIDTNQKLMNLVNHLQKEMLSLKQTVNENNKIYKKESIEIQNECKQNTQHIEAYKSDIISIQNDVQHLNDFNAANKSKKNDVFDVIIELRKDLEALKKQVLEV